MHFRGCATARPLFGFAARVRGRIENRAYLAGWSLMRRSGQEVSLHPHYLCTYSWFLSRS